MRIHAGNRKPSGGSQASAERRRCLGRKVGPERSAGECVSEGINPGRWFTSTIRWGKMEPTASDPSSSQECHVREH